MEILTSNLYPAEISAYCVSVADKIIIPYKNYRIFFEGQQRHDAKVFGARQEKTDEESER